MLIEFRVRNFRSFLREQVFHYPRQTSRKSRNAQVAVIFGPSGAGKTNLILALATLRELVLRSNTLSDQQYAEQCVPFQFDHALDPATEFEIEARIDHTRYRYSVAYDAQRILFERLLVYRTGKPQRWFERHYDPVAAADHWAPFSPNFNGTRELWRRMTRPKALFLSTAAHLACEQLQPIMRWFEHGMRICLTNTLADLDPIMVAIRDTNMKERLLHALNAADIKVHDVRITEGPLADGELPRVELEYLRPDEAPIWLDSANEGRGTLRLLMLLARLLPAIKRGTLLVVDEFDLGLHPLVAQFVVRLAKNAPAAPGCVQLLLIGNYASLMVPEVLDRDDIWLTEREGNGATCLLPVSVRGPRKGERLGRGYLRGRYGGIPHIHTDEPAPSESEDPAHYEPATAR